MEGPRDPKIYTPPDLESFPPKLEDVVGVFSGYRVKLMKRVFGRVAVVEKGNQKYLIRI